MKKMWLILSVFILSMTALAASPQVQFEYRQPKSAISVDSKFSPDGKYIAMITDSDQLHIFEVATGKVVLQLPKNGEEFSDLKFDFSPTGKIITATYLDNQKQQKIQFYDVINRTLILDLIDASQTYFKRVHTILFGANDKTASIFFTDEGDTLNLGSAIYDLESKKLIYNAEDDIWAFSYANKYIYTFSRKDHATPGTFYLPVLDFTTKKTAFVYEASGSTKGYSVSQDDNFIFSIAVSEVTGYDIEQKTYFEIPDSSNVSYAMFSPNSKYLAVQQYAANSVEWKIFDLKNKTILFAPELQGKPCLKFSEDSNYAILSSCHSKSQAVYDLHTRKVILEVSESYNNEAKISKDGRFVTTKSTENGTVRIYDIVTKQLVYEVIQKTPVATVEFSPDGEYFSTITKEDAPTLTVYKLK